MNYQETKELLMMIQAAFPHFDCEDKKQAIQTWQMMLEEYSQAEVTLAFKSYCKSANSGFAPSVSQIIGELEKVNDLADMDDATALSIFRKALSRGSRAQEEFDRLDPTIQKAIGSADTLFYWATQETKEIGVLEQRFLNNYRQICKRERDYRKMPEPLKLMVDQTCEKLGRRTLSAELPQLATPPEIEEIVREEDGATIIDTSRFLQELTQQLGENNHGEEN